MAISAARSASCIKSSCSIPLPIYGLAAATIRAILHLSIVRHSRRLPPSHNFGVYTGNRPLHTCSVERRFLYTCLVDLLDGAPAFYAGNSLVVMCVGGFEDLVVSPERSVDVIVVMQLLKVYSYEVLVAGTTRTALVIFTTSARLMELFGRKEPSE